MSLVRNIIPDVFLKKYNDYHPPTIIFGTFFVHLIAELFEWTEWAGVRFLLQAKTAPGNTGIGISLILLQAMMTAQEKLEEQAESFVSSSSCRCIVDVVVAHSHLPFFGTGFSLFVKKLEKMFKWAESFWLHTQFIFSGH